MASTQGSTDKTIDRASSTAHDARITACPIAKERRMLRFPLPGPTLHALWTEFSPRV